MMPTEPKPTSLPIEEIESELATELFKSDKGEPLPRKGRRRRDRKK